MRSLFGFSDESSFQYGSPSPVVIVLSKSTAILSVIEVFSGDDPLVCETTLFLMITLDR
jgi:hypothetical protein